MHRVNTPCSLNYDSTYGGLSSPPPPLPDSPARATPCATLEVLRLGLFYPAVFFKLMQY